MIEATRDLHDHELDAAVDGALAQPAGFDGTRGCAVTASKCARMVYALIDEHFGGYTQREQAAVLRGAALCMIRMGGEP